jgi:hypothetical protein
MLKKLFQKLFGTYEPEKVVIVEPVQPAQTTITVSETVQPTSTVTVVEPVAPAPVEPVAPAPVEPAPAKKPARKKNDGWQSSVAKKTKAQQPPSKAPAKKKPRAPKV